MPEISEQRIFISRIFDKAMARLMEIDEKRYMKIKLGDIDPTLSELVRLASKVDVSLDWLIRG